MQKADGLLGIHNKLEALSKVKIQMKKNYLKERNRIDEDLLKVSFATNSVCQLFCFEFKK